MLDCSHTVQQQCQGTVQSVVHPECAGLKAAPPQATHCRPSLAGAGQQHNINQLPHASVQSAPQGNANMPCCGEPMYVSCSRSSSLGCAMAKCSVMRRCKLTIAISWLHSQCRWQLWHNSPRTGGRACMQHTRNTVHSGNRQAPLAAAAAAQLQGRSSAAAPPAQSTLQHKAQLLTA